MAGTKRVRPSASNRDNLERQMDLLDWMHRLLGYESTRELLQDVKHASEGLTGGHSHVYHRLLGRRNKLKISRKDLGRYDRNIIGHLKAINTGRSDPFVLRYFQYLAVLYAEIFLDFYFNRRDDMLSSLEEWVRRRNADALPGELRRRPFTEADLRKLAFWMATGSGKTLIMHINYRQFLDYSKKSPCYKGPPDNILLVTPNEELSKQHLKALQGANIPVARFALSKSGDWETNRGTVRVIEITKIRFKKHDQGVRVPVEAFGGNNLVFVDEGHKGSSGQSWRDVRNKLGETGFTFEYSATFGEALAAARNAELEAEYGRAIVFDYSYRHFYDDGYGKDFRIVNLWRETTEDQTDILLLANLLSFYEQHLVFDECGEELRPYNLEKPLWVFVGNKVNAVYKEKGKDSSDILTVVRFLHRLLAESNWATGTIGRLLDGKSGLKDDDGEDVFRGWFRYLRSRGAKAAGTYRGILRKVMHADHEGGLRVSKIRNSKGELGLKAAGSDEYFGVIDIGDEDKFRKLVESGDRGIAVEEDIDSQSLFSDIERRGTTIEILVGSRKFMEGWDSRRVSNMGLLNIGKKEGSQIIQLFGRGVRLRGRDMSMKRSSPLDGERPEWIQTLETLNIFALRADYMGQFRKHLERGDVPVHSTVDVQLPICPNRDLLGRGLLVPRLPEGASFAEESMMLDVDKAVRVRVDLSSKVSLMVSGMDGITETVAAAPGGGRIPGGSLELVDMPDIYAQLLAHKARRGWHSMAVRPDMPGRILAEAEYEIVVDDKEALRPRSFGDVPRLQEAATLAVLEYAERFYRMRQEKWTRSRLAYRTLDENDPNFQKYTVTVPDSKKEIAVRVQEFVQRVQDAVEECGRLYAEEFDALPNVHFDRHLYLPLLLARDDGVKTYPPGLNEGEAKFVQDLREYCTDEKDEALADSEIFLLRNLGRGKGVGFFQTYGVYPDFILWVKSGGAQRVVFVEPHGMHDEDAPDKSERVQLHRRMRELTVELGKRPGMADVTLDSYMVSVTAFEDLAKRYSGDWDRRRFAAEHHILFPERGPDYDYLTKIICGDGAQQQS